MVVGVVDRVVREVDVVVDMEVVDVVGVDMAVVVKAVVVKAAPSP